jgi:hypothetical protein
VSPVDIASARRKADHEELERAKEAGDWGAALDVLHANLHEIESLLMRSLSRHDATHAELAQLRGLIETTLARVGDLVIALERATPAPSYRPPLASANQLDAQALGNSIEALATLIAGNTAAIIARIDAIERRVGHLDAELGETPDPTRGEKGSGMRLVVHKLQSKTLVAQLAIGGVLVGAASGGGVELIKHLFHLIGG